MPKGSSPNKIMQLVMQSPAIAGVALAAAGSLVWAVLEYIAAAAGAGSPQPTFDGIFVVLLLIQTGYFVAAAPLLQRAGQRCLQELSPLLDRGNAEVVALSSRFSAAKFPIAGWAILVGGLLAVVLQEAQFQRVTRWLADPDFALGEMCTVLAAWMTWGLGLSVATRTFLDALAMRRLGSEGVAVDLMRVEQLAAFSRYGLHLAGTVVGLMALWAASLVLITSFVGTNWDGISSYVGIFMAVLYLLLSVSVYLFPQLGIREGIRKEKNRVYEQITHLLPNSLETIAHAELNPERLAALLSSRSQIQGVAEWPTGQHTRLRLAFYLLVPLLSWSAASLVEETISWLLS